MINKLKEFFSKNKTVRIFLAIILIVVLFIIVATAYWLWLPRVAKCWTSDCVKRYALSQNFNPNDCARIIKQDLKDDCYFIYLSQNPKAEQEEKNGGKRRVEWCGLIKGSKYIADCRYISLGIRTTEPEVITALLRALTSLDPNNCTDINYQWKEECEKGIAFIKGVMEKKNMGECSASGEKFSSYVQQLCLKKLFDIQQEESTVNPGQFQGDKPRP
jgi:hypothetical protein